MTRLFAILAIALGLLAAPIAEPATADPAAQSEQTAGAETPDATQAPNDDATAADAPIQYEGDATTARAGQPGAWCGCS